MELAPRTLQNIPDLLSRDSGAGSLKLAYFGVVPLYSLTESAFRTQYGFSSPWRQPPFPNLPFQ